MSRGTVDLDKFDEEAGSDTRISTGPTPSTPRSRCPATRQCDAALPGETSGYGSDRFQGRVRAGHPGRGRPATAPATAKKLRYEFRYETLSQPVAFHHTPS
jgi:hypothetical protein